MSDDGAPYDKAIAEGSISIRIALLPGLVSYRLLRDPRLVIS
jgi:hypothetical protein